MSDWVIVEFMTPQENELMDLQELVITPLYNFSKPFIRYRIGDYCLKSAGGCECGLNLPTIGKIIGRTSSIVYSTDGKKVPSVFLGNLFKTLSREINVTIQFRVLQKSGKLLKIQIVKNLNFGEKR